MRAGASDATLTGAHRYWSHLSAWRGRTLLAESIPFTEGGLKVNGTAEVPESLIFTVPASADGRSWVPVAVDDPLNVFGQYVDLDITVQSSVTTEQWTFQIGRYKIQGWEYDGEAVSVECVGVLQAVLDARFRTPQSPRAGETLGTLLRRLVPAGIGVSIDGGLIDRLAAKSFQWPEDRLTALYEITDAWPARLRTNSAGGLLVLPALPGVPVPVLSWTDGQRGTLIQAPRSGTRDDIYNVVVVKATGTDDLARPPIQAEWQVSTGPLAPAAYGGEVVTYFSSPLVTTLAQAQAAAATVGKRVTRRAELQDVTCIPDPRVEQDDPVAVTKAGVTRIGWVISYTLPLLHTGTMSVEVGVVS